MTLHYLGNLGPPLFQSIQSDSAPIMPRIIPAVSIQISKVRLRDAFPFPPLFGEILYLLPGVQNMTSV